MAMDITFARVLRTTLPPTRQCKVVKLTPLRSVLHEKVKHRRPQVRFSRETVSAARVTSGHCSTLWVREQNLGECTRIPHARNSRGITQDSKRRSQKRVQGTTTLACQCGQRRRHRCGTHPSHRVSPSQFLLSSWTRFAFLRSLSWLLRCIAPHSPSCFVDLFAVHALWKVRISVVWVSSSAILCSGACIHTGGSSSLQHSSQLSQNRSSHRRPQSFPKSKPRPPKWARDTFFRHSGSSPLLSTCRHVEVSAVDVHVVLIGFFFLSSPSSSHAKPLLLVDVLLQCAEIAAYVLFPYLVVSGTSAWPSETLKRTNPWSTCSEARVRSVRLQPQHCFCGAEMS